MSGTAEDIKNLNNLNIFKANQYAGRLIREQDSCRFVYDKDYLNSDSPDLCIHMPKTKAEYSSNGTNLFPYFAGLLPEGLRLRSLVQKIKTSEDDLFSLLAAIGRDCVGNVYVKNQEASTNDIPMEFAKLDFYELFQQSLNSESVAEQDSSLAGVQEKISASMISFPLNIAKKNHQYILKLNPKDKPQLVQNELACLKTAKLCGIDVAKAKLVKDSKHQFGLLVERFDRKWIEETQDFLKIHQEDGCQFLNLYPSEKYRISFRKLCQGLENHTTAPKIEILKALRIYAFSYLIGNGDLHGKNLSLRTFSDRTSALAPAYDLLCTYIHKDHKMALKLNGKDDNIKRPEILAFAKTFSIPEKSTIDMLDKLLTSYSKHNHKIQTVFNEKQKRQFQSMTEKRIRDLSD